MGITAKVNTGSTLSQASAATVTCTITGTVTAGNLVHMFFRLNTTGRTFSSASDSLGNTFLNGGIYDPGVQELGMIYSVIATGGANPVITLTLAGGNSGGADAFCVESSSTTGWPSGTGSLDQASSGNRCTAGCTTTATSGTVTTTQNETLAWAYVRIAASRTIVSNDTGYSDGVFAGSLDAVNHDEFKVLSSTQAAAISFVYSGAASTWNMIGFAFKNTASSSNRRVIMVS